MRARHAGGQDNPGLGGVHHVGFQVCIVHDYNYTFIALFFNAVIFKIPGNPIHGAGLQVS